MNPPIPDADDEHLRSLFQQAAPPLPDHGFTAGVLTRLPAARPAPMPVPLWAAIGAFVGMAIASVGITYSVGRAPADVSADQLLAPLVELLKQPFVGVALGVTVFSLAAAWFFIRQHTPTVGPRLRWRFR